MTRFLHAADIHLDSPLQKLARYEGAPVDALKTATRRAFDNLIDLAVDRRVDFVLIAGDLFDRDWKDYNTGLYFHGRMSRLRDAGIPVFIIAGNHDAASRITRSLKPPGNVTLLPADRPQTIHLEALNVALHGQGYPTPAVTDNLAAAYPPPVPGCFNIGLLHTSLDGREGHEPYAPCRLDDLREKGYDYWALGHVHDREVIHHSPCIVFPGNLQGRHARETGPKGCMIVAIDDGGAAEVTFHPLDVVRWCAIDLDLSSVEDEDALLAALSEHLEAEMQLHPGLPLAIRFTLCGTTALHDTLMADPDRWRNQIRAKAIEIGDGMIWIEKVIQQTRPVSDTDASPTIEGPVATLLQLLETAADNPDIQQRLTNSLSDLHRKLPAELKQAGDGFDPRNPRWLAETLEHLRPFLLRRLFSEKESE